MLISEPVSAATMVSRPSSTGYSKPAFLPAGRKSDMASVAKADESRAYYRADQFPQRTGKGFQLPQIYLRFPVNLWFDFPLY